ncbi:hypothetical protein [Burkholderia sp. S-53]|uniref:hypothetical protein n=1 Tax=Burkholderia sp. S-53 TaxID=2906514 RepID=UPI0021D0ECBD|nr:hypothetical protein [Burkholderia sp. S-53]UXU90380.1 hypothetical protein LXM88_34360 [Burkholderia sp. S-53]
MTTGNILQPIPVIRDKDGCFMHPDLRHFRDVTLNGAKRCGATEWAALKARAGIKTSVLLLQSEPEDHPAVDAYFVRGEGVSRWDPVPPSNWWLLAISDDDHGPYALFATHADEKGHAPDLASATADSDALPSHDSTFAMDTTDGKRTRSKASRFDVLTEARMNEIATSARILAAATDDEVVQFACAIFAASAVGQSPAPPEDVRAWESDDGRVITDVQKQQALRDGDACASSVRPYSIALVRRAPTHTANQRAPRDQVKPDSPDRASSPR